ncbi:MAG: hypothetical protein RLY20_446 [Verrucomicrobiota bacterium]|jgi:hypothetical protein
MNDNAQATGGRNHWMKLQLIVALALVMIGGLGAHFVQTAGGTVEITGFKLSTTNGQWVAADLFKPKFASASNRVPLVVVCPGFERSKETMTPYSIELARRGAAVITIDPYNQGASSATMQRRSATLEGYGLIPMIEHVWSSTNFDYVDKTRIGAAGYSAGGNATLQTASHFGGRQLKASRRSSTKPAIAPGNREKLAAAFIGGYVLTLSNSILATVNANVGLDYALYDEGAFRTELGHARLRTAPEALRLVNTIFPENEEIVEVEIDKYYGEVTNRTLRVVHNTPNIHPLLPYDPRHISHLVDFFTKTLALDSALLPSQQTWLFKEAFTLLALIGGFLFLVPFAALLLRLPCFRTLAQPIPPPLPAPQGRGKILFWTTFIVAAVIACFLFIPMARATEVLFPEASSSRQTWWFPQRINNAILLWAVANGIIGLLIFSFTYRFFGKKNGVTPAMWGIRTTPGELTRTLLLALIVFAGFYGLVFASYAAFHTDLRFTFLSAPASFPPKMLLVALEYLPLFFIFYLANSIRVNSANRFAGQREWVNQLINALANSVGLVLILIIQYSHYLATGTVFWTQEWLYTNLLLGVIPMMFVLPYFNRAFFRLTGKVYLGPMVTTLVYIMMMLTSNVCYIPL